jgi:hypothetical protein
VLRATLQGLTFKLAMRAEQSRRRLRDFERLPDLVRGVTCVNGVSREKQNQEKLKLQRVTPPTSTHVHGPVSIKARS